jgi:thiamine-phosphate pyrophosphorylase
VFGTATKDTGYTSVGLQLVSYAAAAIARAESTRDLVAIGGVTLDRAATVIQAGATAVAVISDLLATGDPQSRVRAYLARLSE